MTATVKVTAGDKPVRLQRMDPTYNPARRIGPTIRIPARYEMSFSMHETQGLAMMEEYSEESPRHAIG